MQVLLPLGLLGMTAACADRPGTARGSGVEPCRAEDGPAVLDYQLVRVLPHDSEAFTQGLLIADGWLFESTGLYGESSLRKLELSTGRETIRVGLPAELFGEGLALADGRLYQLTWRENVVRIYRPADLRLMGQVHLEGEGWGLTFDGDHLVQSDGSATLYFRAVQDLREVRRLKVTVGEHAVSGLNELEYADGRILANIFQSGCIAVIDPADGAVTGWLDIRGLALRARQRSAEADVPNGIAYDPPTGTYYLTGKRWPQLFEIRIAGPSGSSARPASDRR